MLYVDSISELGAGEEELDATLLFVALRCVINKVISYRNNNWSHFTHNIELEVQQTL